MIQDNSLVKQRGDAPEDGKIFLVRDGKRHWILHSSWVTAHASEFPRGVQMVSAADLQAIPLGDDISAEQ